jgi:hypothetical protein
MLVAPCVVKPGLGISILLPLCIIGTSRPLKIFTAHKKFRGRKFRHIMKESLPVESYMEAPLHNEEFMLCNGLKMTNGTL